jgi:hypothetical protein
VKLTLRSAILLFLLLSFVSAAFADDQQRVRKEVNKFTALATDATGRMVVNSTIADMFKIKRMELVMYRHNTGVNYGSLFIVRSLIAAGVNVADITVELRQGHNVYQIGNAHQANWKKIGDEAKLLNKKIDDNLYQHFAGSDAEKERDKTDPYRVAVDAVKADTEVGDGELNVAQNRYLVVRERALVRTDAKLDTSNEMAVRHGTPDIKDRGPQPDQTGTIGMSPKPH